MQKVVIDLRTGQVNYIDLTSREEADHIAEGQARLIEDGKQARKRIKTELLAKMLEIREMRQNRATYTTEDIDEKQIEIDRLREIVGV